MSDRGMSNCGKQLSMDEKRAFLGCYYLSSCVRASSPASLRLPNCRVHYQLSLSTSRLDCMAFPSYIQDCCNDLEAGSQSSDTYLVYLMKLQSLVERQRLGGLWDFGDQDCLRAPIGFQVRTYQLELQSFKLSLPAGYITNRESPCLAVDEEATRIVPRSLEISLSIVTSLKVHFRTQIFNCSRCSGTWRDSQFELLPQRRNI